MTRKIALTLSMILLASAGVATQASAQEKTRAEVRQELVQAEANGSRLVTDTSYPDVNPIFAQQATHRNAQPDSEGPAMSGSTAAGQRACVGPAGFCTPYFGS